MSRRAAQLATGLLALVCLGSAGAATPTLKEASAPAKEKTGAATAAPAASKTESGKEAKAPGAAVEIVHAEFGTFDASSPDDLVFTPGNVVPHREGQRYGWVIELRGGKRSVAVREEYVQGSTPAPIEDPISDSLSIPVAKRNQVSQRQLVPVDNLIFGEWAIGPKEPAGHRHLRVVIEDQAAVDFEYDVK